MAKKKQLVEPEEEFFGEDDGYDEEPESEVEEVDYPDEVEQEFPIAAQSNKLVGSVKGDPTRINSATPESQKEGEVVEKRPRFGKGTVIRTRS